jgi:hypothetical protein
MKCRRWRGLRKAIISRVVTACLFFKEKNTPEVTGPRGAKDSSYFRGRLAA